MPSSYFWTLFAFSAVMVLAGLAFRRQQPDTGTMMALLGLVVGLFTLGFIAAPFVL
jgi:hypothetical protein